MTVHHRFPNDIPYITSHCLEFVKLLTWVVDHGHLSISLFDLEISRGGLDAQDIIICRVDHHDEQELVIREMKKKPNCSDGYQVQERKMTWMLSRFEKKSGREEEPAQPSEIY